MGRAITLSKPPQRIISLVPSQTELLFDLGLSEKVVGITKFCVHPKAWRKEKAIVGGTKNFRFDVIDELSPDLIIGNKEENYQEGIEQLSKKHPVWMSDIFTLKDALKMISSIGEITATESKTNKVVDSIKSGFTNIPDFKRKRVAYFIWKSPYMVVGGDTFIDNILDKIGLINVYKHKKRYFEIKTEELIELNLDYVLLSSEPYPFKLEDCEELRNLLNGVDVKVVDGEMFSWYGSRLLQAPEYFKGLYNEIFN